MIRRGFVYVLSGLVGVLVLSCSLVPDAYADNNTTQINVRVDNAPPAALVVNVVDPIGSEYETDKNSMELELYLKNVQILEVYDGQTLLYSSSPGIGSVGQNYIVPLNFDRVGEYNLRIVGYDSASMTQEATLKVVYSPKSTVPETGFLTIGGLTIGRTDYVLTSMIVLACVLAMIWFVGKRKQEQKQSSGVLSASAK